MFLSANDFYALALITILGFQVSLTYRLEEVEKELKRIRKKLGVVGFTPQSRET